MMGPLVGTAFYAAFGFIGVFFGLAVVFLLAGVTSYALLGPDREYKVESEEGNIATLLIKPRIAVTLLPLVFAMLAIGAQDVFMSPHLESYGLSTTWIGITFGLSDAGYLVTSILLAYTLQNANKKVMNTLSTIVGIVAICLVGPWPEFIPSELPIVLAGFVSSPIGLSVVFIEAVPSLLEVATVDLGLANDDLLTDQLSGSNCSIALENVGASIGEIVGPAMAGFMVPILGVKMTCMYLGIVGATILIVYAGFFFIVRKTSAIASEQNKNLI